MKHEGLPCHQCGQGKRCKQMLAGLEDSLASLCPVLGIKLPAEAVDPRAGAALVVSAQHEERAWPTHRMTLQIYQEGAMKVD